MNEAELAENLFPGHPVTEHLRQESARAEPILEAKVYGTPAPAGSKTARVVTRKDGSIVYKNGRPVVNVVDSAIKTLKPWRSDLIAQVGPMREGLELERGPLGLELHFTVPRPTTHFRKGRSTSHLLTSAAPLHPIVKPDALKLARAVEDALTGLVWHDDAQVVDLIVSERYGAPEGVSVRVWRVP